MRLWGKVMSGSLLLFAAVCVAAGVWARGRTVPQFAALTAMLGYFPARRLGLGEDLPAKVAMQWAGRRSPELRPTGTGPGCERQQLLLDRCAALQRPALLVSISDDAFATAAGTKRLLSYYPRLFPLEHLVFTPADAGIARVGHFGFFGRKAGTALWPRLLARLGENLS